MKTWAGGGSRVMAAPPAATPRFQAPQATGPSNTLYKHKKKKYNT